MNTYKCFHRGKTAEVYAETSYAAQKKAAVFFNAKKAYEGTVVLCEKKGEQVVQSCAL